MDESFTITVSVNGHEYSFDARLVTIGYNHKFIVQINGSEVIYEPDEERHYRAILQDIHASIKAKDVELIKAIGEKIESTICRNLQIRNSDHRLILCRLYTIIDG